MTPPPGAVGGAACGSCGIGIDNGSRSILAEATCPALTGTSVGAFPTTSPALLSVVTT